MINSIGLPNKGLDGFLAEDLPRLAELPVPLVVSVMATSREEFARLVEGVGEPRRGRGDRAQRLLPQRPLGPDRRRAAGRDRGAAGSAAAADGEAADREADAQRRRPGGGRGRRRGGWSDAVSLINTLKASAIDPATRRPGIAAGHGGLSGPAVRPVAVAQVRAVAAAVGLPVIGMGGISSGADALEMLAAGASVIAVGTESFRDPLAGRRVAAELAELLPAPPSCFRNSTSTRGRGEFEGNRRNALARALAAAILAAQ